MAITVRTPTSANTAAGTSATLTPGYPSDAAAGDLILELANLQSASTLTISTSGPAGNTRIETQQGSSNNTRLDAWQGIATTNDLQTPVSFTTSAARNLSVNVAGFAGCTYESITDGTQTAGVSAPIPTVTPSKDSSLLVLLVSANGGTGGTGFTLATPSGWTPLVATYTTTGGATVRGAAAMFTRQLGTGTAGTSQGGGTLTTNEGATNRFLTAVAVLPPTAAPVAGAAAGSMTVTGAAAGAGRGSGAGSMTVSGAAAGTGSSAATGSMTVNGTAAGTAAAAGTGSMNVSGTAAARAAAAAAGSMTTSGTAAGAASSSAIGTLTVTGTATGMAAATPAAAAGALTITGTAAGQRGPAVAQPAVDWALLSPAQQKLVATTTAQQISYGCELLNPDLTVNQDLSGYLDQTTGDVQWTADATVHRDCQVTLTKELAWGTALLRVFMLKTDIPSGLTVRRNLGVFCLTAPDRNLGVYIRDVDGSATQAFEVTGQDRLYLLTRPVGYSYSVASGTNVISALQSVFTAAGVATGTFLVDSSASSSTVPSDMTWPLVASSSDSTPAAYTQPNDAASSGGSSDSTAWLDIFNDLLGLIGYRALWCDENGVYRCSPWADPATQPPSFTFDADDVYQSPVAQDRKITKDLWAAPNQWVGRWQNMAGNAPPTSANGGIFVVNNVSNGPASQTARNLVWPIVLDFNAASVADFQNQVNARAASDQRVTTTFAVNTAPFPGVAHEDVYSYSDTQANGLVKVRCASWQAPLDGSDFEFGWESIT